MHYLSIPNQTEKCQTYLCEKNKTNKHIEQITYQKKNMKSSRVKSCMFFLKAENYIHNYPHI